MRFSLPSIVMMIFTSIYSIIDGIFVSNIVGETAFAAVNLIFPVCMIVGAFGFMLGTGGTAIVAQTLGEKRREDANRYFSFVTYVTAAVGAVVAAICFLLMDKLALLFGAEGELLENCVLYGRIIISASPFFMLQNLFQSFFVAAEKPTLGLWVTVGAGVTNIILDALFVWVLGWGLAGAAIATAASQVVGAIVPLVYFVNKNSSLLKLTGCKFYGRVLLRSVTNGSSEFMSNISASVVTIVYNMQLMELEGERGVSAYGIIMYLGFVFVAIFIGYSIGTSPIVGFNYGAKNTDELKSLLKKSCVIISVVGISMALIGFVFAEPLSAIFVSYDKDLLEMTKTGMQIYSVSFLMCGFSIYGSAFFTSLGNGPVSATISFLRTFVYQIIPVLILPSLLGITGIWLSIVSAEVASVITTVIFTVLNRKKYQYM